jgi:endo-1,3-1,4-beta-glycanase ExoK
MKNLLKVSGFLAAILCPQLCLAVGSAELYTSKAYRYGRFEARTLFPAGDGVVGAFFLWKDGSQVTGTYWNELDYEKIGADCSLQSNAYYGNPGVVHTMKHTSQADLCGGYHTYAFEWTPDTIRWLLDGTAVRTETGATAQAFADNATEGMQIHFNLWPGDESFGGSFKESILPVHQYIDWVQYSTYDSVSGTFTLSWREDFTGTTLPTGWLTGDWQSPKMKSTHAPQNVNLINGYAVLSLTADNALGPAGAMPGGAGGMTGTAGSGGTNASGGSGNASGGAPPSGGSVGSSGSTGTGGSLAAAGAGASPGAGGAAPGAAGSPSGVAGTGTVPTGGASGTSGPANGSSAPTSSDGCSLGHAPARSAFWWGLGIPALALLRRRARRSNAT